LPSHIENVLQCSQLLRARKLNFVITRTHTSPHTQTRLNFTSEPMYQSASCMIAVQRAGTEPVVKFDAQFTGAHAPAPSIFVATR
jgi:hypothetical protein